jgi:integrase
MAAPRRVRLTRTLVAQLEPRAARYYVMDSEQVGLAVRINATSKVWVAVWCRDGQRHRETLGEVGAIPLERARELVRARLSQAALERLLPALSRAEETPEEAGPTWGALLASYLEWARAHRRSWPQDAARIERHGLLARWGSRLALAIERREILALGREVGTRTPVEANRVLELVRRVYSLAEDQGHLPWGSNPATRLRAHLYPEGERHDRSATADEVLRLRRALYATSWGMRGLVWLLLLTGLRRREASRLEWARVNLGDGEIILAGRRRLGPRSVYLAETKSGRPVALPLSSAARELLASLPSRTSSPWVFPGRPGPDGEPRPLEWVTRPWNRARARAGCSELTLHDLRATVATWMARAGVADRVISAALNQVPGGGVLNRYVDDVDARLREALEEHGKKILRAADVESAAALVWPLMAQPLNITRISDARQKA